MTDGGITVVLLSFRSHHTEEEILSTRNKLNVAAIHGSLVVAALVGWAFHSWIVFLLAVIVLIATAIHRGDIRFDRRGRSPPSR